MSCSTKVRARRMLVSMIAASGMVAALPAAASAGPGLGVTPVIDNPVLQVGETGRGGTITIENLNLDDPGLPPEGSATLCRSDSDPIRFPRCIGAEGIVLTPSCGVTSQAVCRPAVTPPGGADPDVFRLSPTAVGVNGTVCAGVIFAVTRVPGEFGKFRFTPPGNSHIVLPARGTTCTIRFEFEVLRSPTLDSNPNASGIQTDQVVQVTQQSGAGNPAAAQAARVGITTVIRAAPSIATNASPNITLGAGTLGDSATVSGRVSPQSGATIDFRLYGPDDNDCLGDPVFVSLNVPYPIEGGSVDSARYTPTQPGVYRWRAFYSGDSNNAPVAGACNAANENVTVSRVAPPPGPNPPAPNPPAPQPPAVKVIDAPAGPAAVPTSTTVCVPPPDQRPPGTAPNTPTPQSNKICARGAATIKGPSGCVSKPFRAVVRGTQITRVVFTLDGKRVRSMTKPNSGSVFVLPINPRNFRPGVHRVVATITFRKQSGAAKRTQRVTFSRCKRAATAAPAFTG